MALNFGSIIQYIIMVANMPIIRIKNPAGINSADIAVPISSAI